MDRMCENCGYDYVPDGEDYCPNCGDKVPSGKCPFCGADVYPSNHYKCPRCGADIREDYATHMAKVHADLEAIKRQREAQVQEQVVQDTEQHLPKDQTISKKKRQRQSWLHKAGWAFVVAGFVECVVAMYCQMFGLQVRFFIGIIEIIVWVLLSRYFFHLANKAMDQKKRLSLVIAFFVIWIPVMGGLAYTGSMQYSYYNQRDTVIDEARQAGKQGDWQKAAVLLEPYKNENDRKYKDFMTYCQVKADLANGKSWDEILDMFYDYDTKYLPTEAQDDGEKILDYIFSYSQYLQAKEKYEKIHSPSAMVRSEEYRNVLAQLKKIKDDEFPSELVPQLQAFRGQVQEQIAAVKPEVDATLAEWRQQKEKALAESKAIHAELQKDPAYRKRAKDDEDYSRGYDDGRFSAAEGIWEDYDENESEAYINGYQDGQGEAREEMADERQRQQQQKSSK